MITQLHHDLLIELHKDIDKDEFYYSLYLNGIYDTIKIGKVKYEMEGDGIKYLNMNQAIKKLIKQIIKDNKLHFLHK